MKIAYIYPACIVSDPNLTPARFEPLGLLYIVSSAEAEGFIDYRIFIPEAGESLGEFVKRIVNFSPDVMAFSIMTYQVNDAIEILRKVRERIDKKIWAIAGGPHPTIDPPSLLKNGFDICVLGEGERTFAELLMAIDKGKDFEKIKGIAFISSSQEIKTTQPRERQNPDELPFPKRIPSLLDGRGYKSMAYPAPAVRAWASIIATRGCPYNCSFCDAVIMWNRKVKARSVKNVMEEISFLNRVYGVHLFHFADLNFTVNNTYVMELCRAIIRSGLKINWFCMTSLNALGNTEMLRLMREAGCSLVSVGVESVDGLTLKYIGKPNHHRNVNEVLIKVLNVGIPVNIFYMIGFPWQTENTLLEELEALKQIEACKIRITIATPFPKTPFWKEVSKLGIEKNYRLFDTDHLVYNHPALTDDKLKKLQKLFLKEFYLNPHYKARISHFLSRFPEYKRTFINYWNTLEFGEELIEYLGLSNHFSVSRRRLW